MSRRENDIETPVRVRAHHGQDVYVRWCLLKHHTFAELKTRIREAVFRQVRSTFQVLNDPAFVSVRPPPNIFAGGDPPPNFMQDASAYKTFYEYLLRHPNAPNEARMIDVELYVEPDRTEGLSYVNNVRRALGIS